MLIKLSVKEIIKEQLLLVVEFVQVCLYILTIFWNVWHDFWNCQTG